MNGKVCVVTGANSGIGKATAAGLAGMGATVVMVCRNRRRGEAARDEIAGASGNDHTALAVADLASQASVRNLADDLPSPMRTLYRVVSLFFLSPERGARTSIYLASSPEVEGVSGKYFIKRKQADSAAQTYDPELASRLWAVSAELTGLPT